MVPGAADRYEVDGFAFIGRTFAEYCTLFDLDPVELAGERILDCPGGPSSFTAIASTIGADAAAVDSQYGPAVDALESRCETAIADVDDQLREKRDLFVFDYYGTVETRIRYLRAAAARFLADYAQHPGRYVPAALPTLPFETDAFDLALSANFLFLYDDRLDLEFHLASLQELARVASEVRVFPLASLDATRSDRVAETVGALRADGYGVDVRPVDYEFQQGATEMLVVE